MLRTFQNHLLNFLHVDSSGSNACIIVALVSSGDIVDVDVILDCVADTDVSGEVVVSMIVGSIGNNEEIAV